jgi:hypothetical protein
MSTACMRCINSTAMNLLLYVETSCTSAGAAASAVASAAASAAAGREAKKQYTNSLNNTVVQLALKSRLLLLNSSYNCMM